MERRLGLQSSQRKHLNAWNLGVLPGAASAALPLVSAGTGGDMMEVPRSRALLSRLLKYPLPAECIIEM